MTMRWMTGVVAAAVLAGCGGEPPVYPEADFAERIAIAPLDEALTFARIEVDGRTEVLAVGAYEGERVTGFNLTQALGGTHDDPVTLFQELGYEALQARIAAGLAEAPVEVAVESLVIPLELTDAHVAAGTNFAAHADESEVEDGPFLFAKLVTPTRFSAPVSAGDALLDYEVELAFVTLDDTPLPEVPEYLGLILANDYTNRAALLRNVNPADVTSGDGFTTGKSAEGYLPVGNLLVIPRDVMSFVQGIELKLAVNGKLRQQGAMTLAIWDLPELFRQTHAKRDARWLYQGESIGLPVVEGALPARTLVIAGTPAGTVFQGVPNGAIAAGVLGWAAGGWGEPITHHAIESYIADAQKKGMFLQPGDQVRIRVDRLGAIENEVEE